jgi:ABC-2 type transport system permease protein
MIMTTAVPVFQAGLRTPGDDLKAVPNVLKSEWIKLSSLRSSRAILALTAAAGGFSAWAVATLVKDEVQTVAQVFVYSTVLTAIFATVAGILLFTSEAQHGTLGAALTAQPARWVIAVAKTVIAVGLGLVLGAAGMVTSIGGAFLGGLELGNGSAMITTSLWALSYTALAAVLGLGVGMVVRHSSAAISGLLVWGLVIENLLALFVPARIFRFLPFYAGDGILGIASDFATPESIAVAFSRSQNALLFGGYAVAALIIGTVLLYRRDTN